MSLGEALELPIAMRRSSSRPCVLCSRNGRGLWPSTSPRLGLSLPPTSRLTHWGYCDLDMVIGNLPLFIEQAELDRTTFLIRSATGRRCT